MEWKPAKGYPNYEVSTGGQIRNKDTKKILSPKERWDGYSEVTLMKNSERKYVKVHRIVASTFELKGEGNIINHKNGKRDDNRLANLQKTTSSENNTKKNKKDNTNYQNRSNETKWRSRKK